MPQLRQNENHKVRRPEFGKAILCSPIPKFCSIAYRRIQRSPTFYKSINPKMIFCKNLQKLYQFSCLKKLL